jgi:hypothetical protein
MYNTVGFESLGEFRVDTETDWRAKVRGLCWSRLEVQNGVGGMYPRIYVRRSSDGGNACKALDTQILRGLESNMRT